MRKEKELPILDINRVICAGIIATYRGNEVMVKDIEDNNLVPTIPVIFLSGEEVNVRADGLKPPFRIPKTKSEWKFMYTHIRSSKAKAKFLRKLTN